MPVIKEKNGTWTVRISKRVDGKRIQKVKRGFRTRAEASMYEAQAKVEGIGSTSAPFETMLNAYLDYSEASKTSRYLKTTFVTRHFPMRSEPINKITKEKLVEWRNALRSSGIATRTANRGMAYVRSVFSYAHEIYGLPNNGTVLKSFKLTKEDKKEMEVWSPQEFNQFLEAVPDGYYKAYFTFLFWSGARRSEALAVCKDDFKGNTVRIWRSIKHYSNGFLPLKTDTSERTIALDKKTMEILEPFIADAKPFLFGGIRSLPITSVQKQFAAAIRASGVKPIRIHDLRHSHASLLIASGVPVLAVSKRLGHSSVNITLNTYAHLLQRTEDEMIDAIDTLRQKEKV